MTCQSARHAQQQPVAVVEDPHFRALRRRRTNVGIALKEIGGRLCTTPGGFIRRAVETNVVAFGHTDGRHHARGGRLWRHLLRLCSRDHRKNEGWNQYEETTE
jgi:hypothetical protein